ncbi:hypothetical protein ACWGCP_19900, partial [Streptomyces niveus]
GGSAGGGSTSGPDGGAGASGAATGGDPAADPDAGASPDASATPPDPDKQNVAESGGLTPSTVLGIIRWVLLGVLVAGGLAALSGPILLRLSARKSGPGSPGVI